MASTINTNIISINAQRNLALSSSSLATSMQRLSSGLRVNSAKDDAAGLAIAERMNTQVRGLSVASRNANDGISLAQTAEGALGKVGDMLQRMRELAVQAGNTSNSDSDRKALQAEAKQLSDEIDRVAKQTNFNGRKLLEGSFAGAVFQVGANSGDNITLGSLVDTRSDQLSSISYASYEKALNTSDNPMPSIARFNEPIAAGTLAIEVKSTPVLTVPLEQITPANSSEERLGQVVEAINNKSADTGVSAYLRKQGDNSYTIEILSSKLEGSNQALEFDLKGFGATTTGVVLPQRIIASPATAISNADAIYALPYGKGLETINVGSITDLTSIPSGSLSIQTGTAPAVSLGTIPAALSPEQRLRQIVDAINDRSADTGVTASWRRTGSNTYAIDYQSLALNVEPGPTPPDHAPVLVPLSVSFQGFSAPSTGITDPHIAPKTAPGNSHAALSNSVDGYIFSNPVIQELLTTDNTQFSQQYNQALNDYNDAWDAYNTKKEELIAGTWNPSPSDLKTEFDNLKTLAKAVTDVLESAQTKYNDLVATKYAYDHTAPQNINAANNYLNSLRSFESGIDDPILANYTDLYKAKQEIAAKDPELFPLGVLDYTTSQKGVDDIDISTQKGAWVALKKIDSAIDQVNSARATLGAMQSRFENAVNNIDIQSENLSTARGRIIDADFAKETANLSRTQILQQAGTAMVAQANQIPQSVLQLLKG